MPARGGSGATAGANKIIENLDIALMGMPS
jgi:hypothetical protein